MKPTCHVDIDVEVVFGCRIPIYFGATKPVPLFMRCLIRAPTRVDGCFQKQSVTKRVILYGTVDAF